MGWMEGRKEGTAEEFPARVRSEAKEKTAKILWRRKDQLSLGLVGQPSKEGYTRILLTGCLNSSAEAPRHPHEQFEPTLPHPRKDEA